MAMEKQLSIVAVAYRKTRRIVVMRGAWRDKPFAVWFAAECLRKLLRVHVHKVASARCFSIAARFHLASSLDWSVSALRTRTWDDLAKPEWVGGGGVDTLDPAYIIALNFYVIGGQSGSFWVDDLQLLVESSAAGAAAATPAVAPAAPPTDTPAAPPPPPPPLHHHRQPSPPPLCCRHVLLSINASSLV